MARQHEDQVAVIGVAGRDVEERFAEFVERHDLGHVPHIADVDGEVWRRFGIAGQPAWVFVDGETGEAERVFGALSAEEFAARVGG